MIKNRKILFNFRIHKELYDYMLSVSTQEYTTMTQYIISLIKKDKEDREKNNR